MILADLQDLNLFWNKESKTYSLTSGPRSPTKMENSGPRSSRLRSASPPPEAQLSLKGRVEFGMSWPLNCRAFAAAWGVAKSTKQYPALLLDDDEISTKASITRMETQRGLETYPVNL